MKEISKEAVELAINYFLEQVKHGVEVEYEIKEGTQYENII